MDPVQLTYTEQDEEEYLLTKTTKSPTKRVKQTIGLGAVAVAEQASDRRSNEIVFFLAGTDGRGREGRTDGRHENMPFASSVHAYSQSNLQK